MKVLFAVGSEQVSKNIADKYYEKYGEVLEYKNVFFFKALIDEIKRDKTYDRIVVSEEIEEYARTADLEQVDRRLFNYIDQITDETQDTDIIIICGNRRNKGDAFINKLFSIGIYNLLIGEDRNVTPLCDILKKPKTKREAKQYLGIDTSLISDSSMTRDDEVDEYQIRSILSYYDGIRNQPEKYVETFDRISEQYSRLQLIIIFNYLPPAVKKAIAETDRYRHLAAPPGEAAKGPQGAGPAQPQKPAAQPAQQKQTITKPQKEKRGLFGNLKKNKENPNKPTSEQAMESLAQAGSIDLSTNTPRPAPSNQAAEQAMLAQEKAEADRKAAEEAARAREEAAKKQQQEELARKAREEQMLREQQAKAQQNQVDSIQQAKDAEQRRLAEMAKQQQLQKEQQAAQDEQKRLAEMAKQQQLQKEQQVAQDEQKRLAEMAKQQQLQKEQQAAQDEQKRLAEMAKQQQLQKEQQVAQDEQKRLAEMAKQQQLQKEQQVAQDEQKRLAEMAKQQQLQKEQQTTPSGVNIKPNPNAPRAVPNKEFDIDIDPIAKTPAAPQKPAEPVKPVEAPKPAAPVVPPVVPVAPISSATSNEPQQPKYAPPAQHIPTPEQLAGAKVVSPALSAEEARMKEQQENLAKEQQKIREAQEKLEEEKRKLKEEQERLMTAQNQLRADGMMPNMPQYTTTAGATGRPQAPMGSFKKMVVFVGPNKAGTTFVVNAIAHAMANEKIMTSVLDMTRDKGMWYIYSQQYSTAMQKKMANYMQRISDGEELFIETSNPFLKIYSAPGSISDVRRGYKHKNIMDVVRNNANVVLVDADFTTPIDYFDHADEVYVVQDLDILKMPDTTLFLRELKNRGMNMKKVRVILNKYVKTATLNSKKLIQVMSTYSDPGMTYMESELLPSKVDFSTIPYNINNYTKYTEALCTGLNNYKGYSNDFLAVINEIVAKIAQNSPQSKMPQMGQPKGMKKFFG